MSHSLRVCYLAVVLVLAFGCRHSAAMAKSEKRCPVPAGHVAILDTASTRKYGPLISGSPASISHADVERVECLLRDFIRWHLALGSDKRDSLYLTSGGRIRPECFTRNWSQDFRQYAGERTRSGDLLIHMQSMCSRPRTFPGFELDLSKGWLIVYDGGDCYMQSLVNLSRGQVEEYGFNGPYLSRNVDCQ